MKNNNNDKRATVQDTSKNLPTEIWQNILDWIPSELLSQCLLVNKQWNQMTKARFYNFIVIDSKIKYDSLIINEDHQSLENKQLVQKVCYNYIEKNKLKAPADGKYIAQVFPNIREIYRLVREGWESNKKICQRFVISKYSTTTKPKDCCHSLTVILCPYLVYTTRRDLVCNYTNFIYHHRSTLSTITFYNTNHNSRRPMFTNILLYNNSQIQERGF